MKQNIKQRNKPVNIKIKESYLFQKDFEYFLPTINFLKANNVFINNDGLIWKNWKFLTASFVNREKTYLPISQQIKFFIKSWFKAKIKCKEGLWLVDSWSNNYFHWYGDVLYKIYLYRTRLPKLILPEGYLEYPYVEKTLKTLKIDYIIIPKDKKIKVKNFYFLVATDYKSQVIENICGNWEKKPFLKLRNDLNNGLQISSSKERVYITRKNSTHRKVINESELIKCLSKNKFSVYDFDKISWDEQINISSNASLLVSINGAALTNMIYMKESSKIIEIRHPAGIEQNCFFSMCDILGFDYYYLIGNPETHDFHKSNIKVKISDFEKVLQIALSH